MLLFELYRLFKKVCLDSLSYYQTSGQTRCVRVNVYNFGRKIRTVFVSTLMYGVACVTTSGMVWRSVRIRGWMMRKTSE